MQYRFFYPGDEKILEYADLPTQGVIALSLFTTGYDVDDDETIELSVVDLDGNELFSQRVHPQNKEGWDNLEASGGILPKDVQDAPELFQFEEELSDLFENASLVVADHVDFATNMIESSWVTLPAFEKLDLIECFLECHCTTDYTDRPAAAAALDGIAAYYNVGCEESMTMPRAHCVAACYRAFVAECIEQRDGKGEAYWRRYQDRLAAEAAKNANVNAAARLREKRFNQMNGLLWVAAGLIFISLIIQLYQRGYDVGFMIVCGAFSVFAFWRAILSFRR